MFLLVEEGKCKGGKDMNLGKNSSWQLCWSYFPQLRKTRIRARVRACLRRGKEGQASTTSATSPQNTVHPVRLHLVTQSCST